MSKTFLIGLSGPSSSGKTTVARLLRDIFPSTIILHEDDFYRPEDELPVRAGLRDWDCAGAIDIPTFVDTLNYIKTHGALPTTLFSKEDQNAVGESGVKPDLIESLRKDVDAWARDSGVDLNTDAARKLVIVDGFLLFGETVREVRETFDMRILLRARFEDAKKRREARSGYVTLEGFWEDPPNYVDLVVWPGYVEEHRLMFKDGDVEGDVDEAVVGKLAVQVCPGAGRWEIDKILVWVVSRIKETLTSQSQ